MNSIGKRDVWVDKSDSESVSIHFVAAAAALLNAGDVEHYEELRQMAAERFSTTPHAIIADEVVKTCLLRPAGPELLAKLEPLFDAIEGNIPWDRPDLDSELMEAWQTLSMTLARYRTGDYQNAEAWARRCMAHPNPAPSRVAAANALLAMSLHHLERRDEATAELGTTRSAVNDYFQEPFQFATAWNEKGFWFDWIIARLLFQEAEETLARREDGSR